MSDLLLDLEAIKTRTERAHAEIVRLCKADEHWRMSIPAQVDRDSDLILSATANDAERLLEAVVQLQARVDVLTGQVAGRDEQIERVRDLATSRVHGLRLLTREEVLSALDGDPADDGSRTDG